MTEPQDNTVREYEYDHAGGTYTAQLSEKDAERLGARPVGGDAAGTEETAAGETAGEAGTGQETGTGDTKAGKAPAAKARASAPNKGAE